MDARQRLLRATLASVADHGYADAGLREIAATAGVTTGSVYHHFGGKDELLRAAVLEHADLVAAALQASDPGRPVAADARLRALMSGLAAQRDHDRWHGDLNIVINIELPKLSGFQDVFAHMRPMMVNLIRVIAIDGIADGDLVLAPGVTVDEFADVVLAGIVGLELMEARGSLSGSLERALLLHVEATLALARAPSPRPQSSAITEPLMESPHP